MFLKTLPTLVYVRLRLTKVECRASRCDDASVAPQVLSLEFERVHLYVTGKLKK